MSQFQLIYNTESSKINLPINDSQVRLFRRVGVSRNAQDPTAAYVAMHDDGYEEPIGGSGTSITPAYATAYTKTTQTLTSNDPVTWDGLQAGTNITLTNSNKDITVSQDGDYQIEWVVLVRSVHTAS